MKKSFILHYDSLDVLDVITDEQCGKLLKKMRSYHNWNDYSSDDKLVDAVFMQFKNQFDRDKEKYEIVCDKNKDNVRKRWDKKNTTVYDRIRSDTKNTDNDNDNDNDNDKKNVVFKKPTIEEVEQYCKDRSNKVDPIRFVNFYESKGRKVGNQRMKDRQACVRTREQKDKQPEPQTQEDYIKVFKEIWLVQFRKKYWQEKANEIMQVAI